MKLAGRILSAISVDAPYVDCHGRAPIDAIVGALGTSAQSLAVCARRANIAFVLIDP